MGSVVEKLKRWVRKSLKTAVLIALLLVLAAAGAAIYHGYERRHVTVVYMDDIETSHGSISNMSATDAARAFANDAAFDDFAAAFGEEANCRGFTLVRDTAVKAHDYAWSFPYAYWFLNLNPVPPGVGSSQDDEGVDYAQLGWQLRLVVGDDPLRSDISQTSKTAKEAANRVCMIASQKGGAVW